MEQWFVAHPNLVWPIMLILGVIGMAIIWKIASAMYEQLSGILAGAGFMIVGFGMVLYCAFRLLSQSPPSKVSLLACGIGIIVGISAVGAGAFGLRNAADF